MIIYTYDCTFDGLLTVVFDAYFRKVFPDELLPEGSPLPLFYDEAVQSCTDTGKATRVWNALQKKLSHTALTMVTTTWLSELPEVPMLLFRYFRKILDAPRSIEMNFGDPDILEMSKIAKKVSHERHYLVMFARFQKAKDGTYFAAFEPVHNVLPIAIAHFKDRFSDQKWLIYDTRRQYGYYYDMETVQEVTFESPEGHLITGYLNEELMDPDESQFQKLWKSYFKSIAIKERINPKLHRQNMPARYWKHLTEKRL